MSANNAPGRYLTDGIRQAFAQIVADKLRDEGYVDMNAYFSGRMKKDEISAGLKGKRLYLRRAVSRRLSRHRRCA